MKGGGVQLSLRGLDPSTGVGVRGPRVQWVGRGPPTPAPRVRGEASAHVGGVSSKVKAQLLSSSLQFECMAVTHGPPRRAWWASP